MPRVLLINEPRLSDELEHSFVRRPGFAVLQVRGGATLLRLAQGETADLVIALTEMPGMTGLQLCERLRAEPETASVPILIVGEENGRERVKLAGASAFLPTPWTRSQLLGAMRPFLPASDRSADRAQVSLRVLCGAGRESYIAFTRDISSTGLFLKGVSLASPGARVRLRLQIPAGARPIEYDVAGEVVRSAASQSASPTVPGVGLRFVNCPLERRLPIARFVREHAAE